MTQVTPRLFIGSYDEASDLYWLMRNKITRVVNMSEEHVNYFPDNFLYFRGDAFDHPSQSLLKIFKEGYKFMIEGMKNGGSILVHCHAGISRSASMVIYYLMKTYGWSLNKSFAYLKKLRPRIQPNSGFMDQLKIMEKELLSKRRRR